ncbi:MAG: hypothetical protein HY718_11180 [Planctomycetes bacterium]|nr:hypothetical protein [Planctomycetota bacterium]
MRQISHMRSVLVLGGVMLLACTQPQAAATPLPAATPTPALVANAPQKPTDCVPVQTGTLQDVRSTPASPYFVHHPTPDNPTASTILFLPGGSGGRRSAQRVWSNYLSGGPGVDGYRVVIPYSVKSDFLDEAARTFRILDEVLGCYGGDAAKVHLAGVSNGGHVAFAFMLARPDRFATLLGAPGEFPSHEPAAWASALAGRPVFNGVGANDADWKAGVKATHEALVAAGVESVYVEFAGQGHIVDEAFDESVFFDFWAKHS